VREFRRPTKCWLDEAWNDYLYWQTQGKKTLKRINQLLKSEPAQFKKSLTHDTICDTILCMAGVKKIVEKMKNQSNGISLQEADKVLAAYGYRLDRQRGSHCQYINQSGDVLTVVNRNPLKKVYVTAILERIGEK
jgi:predicted RNA binding protein YcfA (HicA-like mRNA interferase family)